jgi:hypothetical protein
MNRYNPGIKAVLMNAFATIAVGWSLHAGATDFALQDNSVTVYNAASIASVAINANGTASPATSLRIGALDYGMPSFDIGLRASNVQEGDHIFWAAVLITGNNNDKYLRAFVDEVYLNVAADGTITGRVNPTSNLTIKMDSNGESVQEEINDIAADNITFAAGNRMTFNASNLIELLGDAANHSARYQRIADTFTTGDSFTYKVLIGPRNYGIQGARLGISNNGSFTAFPLRVAQIVPGDAYIIEGQFSTTTTGGGGIDVSQQVLSAVAKTPSTLLRSKDSVTGLDVSIADGLFFYGASKDRGATTSTNFRAGDNVIIAASVLPQPEDLGKPADIFMVVRTTTATSDTWTYRDASGVFLPWPTVAIPDLRPAGSVSSLKNIEAFEVFSGTLVPAQHRIYVGYRLAGGSVLFYTSQALSLNVTN